MSVKLTSRMVIVAAVASAITFCCLVARDQYRGAQAPVPVLHVASVAATASAAQRAIAVDSSIRIQAMSDVVHFHPQEGMRYTYRFDRQIKITGMTREIPEIRYAGKLRIDVLKARKSGFDALISQTLEQHTQAGEITFKIHVDANAKRVLLEVPTLRNEMDRQHADILKDLAANWMFPLESDTVGSYQANFTPLVAENGFPRFQKTKVAYLRVAGTVHPEILRSSHVLEWDSKQAVPHSVKGEELTRLGSGSMVFRSSSRYLLAFEGAAPIQARELTKNLHPDTLLLSADNREARARARFTAEDWPRLLGRVASVAALSSPEQLELFGDLSAFLSANGEFLPELMAQLSPSAVAAGPRSSLFKLAVGTLATVGSPESQAALVQIYQDPNCPVAGKGTILAALTTTQAGLTSQTREFLLSESQSSPNPDLSSGASWALGSALQNTPVDPSSLKAILSFQQAWVTASSSAQGEGEKLVLLDAMGNSGRAEFMPILSGVINGGADGRLRTKAVYALRFIQSPDAISLLSRELGDSNPSIRLAAASAMQTAPWNAAFQAPLQQCISSEAVGEVLSACQRALKNAQG